MMLLATFLLALVTLATASPRNVTATYLELLEATNWVGFVESRVVELIPLAPRKLPVFRSGSKEG